MKAKLILISALSLALAACGSLNTPDNSSKTVGAMRGKQNSRISQAELDQYNRQRINEVGESTANNAKRRMAIDTTREGIQAGKEGVSLVRDLINLFH